MKRAIIESLEDFPVIAAVRKNGLERALESPANVIFLLHSNLFTLKETVDMIHEGGKLVLVHLDLAEGIGKDKWGLKFLLQAGVDGVISTKTALIKAAKEIGLTTVQRFFVYDSQGVESIDEILSSSAPDIIEIMPGVIGKITERFSERGIPLIAGGLLENKNEVTEALKNGALAVSTGREELWYI